MNRSSWTLGTIRCMADATGTDTIPARKHIGDNVVQVSRGTPGQWRSATAIEATTFAPLPVAAMPV